MILSNPDQLRIEDIDALIKNAVPEGREIEYKQTLIVKTDEEKKEFLADITAFANTNGGQIVYGISENNGVASELCPFEIVDLDTELLRLESLLKDAVEPRISGLRIDNVRLESNKTILLITIPKSWNQPHRVNFKGHHKFYGRNSGGKYVLDVMELRRAFLQTDAISDKIQKFKEERLVQISTGNAQKPMTSEDKLVVHLIPLMSFVSLDNVDLSISKKGTDYTRPLMKNAWESHVNFDGRIGFTASNEGVSGYTQFYRNGIIESVTCEIVRDRQETKSFNPMEFIPELFKHTELFLKYYDQIGVSFPIYLSVTLINYDNVILVENPNRHMIFKHQSFDKKILLLPPLLLEEQPDSMQDFYHPILTTLWNSCGYDECILYRN